MFAITSGNSIVAEISDLSIVLTNRVEDGKLFDTWGDAAKEAIIVNKMVGKPTYKVSQVSD